MLTTLLAAALAMSGAGCSAGGEFEPPLCPTGLARATVLDIEAQGVAIWPEDGTGPPCRDFRLTQADARHFFRAARQADTGAVHATLPESPCVARGRVRFADGTGGRWQIDRFALGWLDRPGRPRMILYCRSCRSTPWSQ